MSLPDREVTVPVAADDLADVLDVLVDNVFAHTADGTPFEVRLTTAEGYAVLVVADRGPGFAPRAEPGGDRVGSTGLGLDIARRVATGCGGDLQVESEAGRGTTVTLRLPLVAR